MQKFVLRRPEAKALYWHRSHWGPPTDFPGRAHCWSGCLFPPAPLEPPQAQEGWKGGLPNFGKMGYLFWKGGLPNFGKVGYQIWECGLPILERWATYFGKVGYLFLKGGLPNLERWAI